LLFYVILLYVGIHIAEGYLITPLIEQKTVFIPPVLTIMGQILIFVSVGGLGLAFASPSIVFFYGISRGELEAVSR
jgi:predicted PurR-regulated permease PerM